MNKHNIQVGQKVWVVEAQYRRGNITEPRECEVLKIGRKYFEVKQNNWIEKYNIETLIEEAGSNYKNKVYLSLQDFLDEKEANALSMKIRTACGQYGNLPFTLDQLRKIAEIINL